MKKVPVTFLFLLFISCALCSALNTVKVKMSGGSRPVEAVEGMVVVKFKSPAPAVQVGLLHNSIGASPSGTIPEINWTAVKLPKGMTVEQGIEFYKNDPLVEDVVPNVIYKTFSTVPNDSFVSIQYGLRTINAFSAWDIEKGFSNKTTIAVIDTGVYGSHSDLYSKIDSNSSRFDSDGNRVNEFPSADICGHGTQVAGIVAAASNNNYGMSGVSWGSQILSLRVFENCVGADEVSISSAVVYAVQQAGYGRVVINLSAGYPPDPGCTGLASSYVNYAVSNGVPFIAAAGNNEIMECPAKLAGAIAVGAVDSSDNVPDFSGKGAELDLVAPGVDVFTTSSEGGFTGSATGTSFAAPHAAGAAALILSALPSATTQQVRDALEQSAKDILTAGKDNSSGWGRLDAYAALSYALGISSSQVTAPQAQAEVKITAFPNPFKPSEHTYLLLDVPIKFLPDDSFKLRIFNQEGELVRTLKSLSWDGKNDAGQKAASGIYIFLLENRTDRAKGKVVLIR